MSATALCCDNMNQGGGPRLPVPPELANVPQRALKDFLAQYSRLFCEQFAPEVAEGSVRAFVNDVLSDAGPAGPARPTDVALEFKHVCRFSGCNLDDCQLCRNNPNKVCESATIFDKQYWVRDDGKGGQLIRARCGADVAMSLRDRASGQALLLPDVALKLYVVTGQGAPPAASEPAGGLYLADDGHPLFAAGGASADEDGGVTLEMAQDEVLGAVARLPELQFLDKNSKFKAGGRTYKAFRLLGRAVAHDPLTGRLTVLAQVESDPFKVTTKKGYDGCRKAEYLFAHQPITDKTFATLGETTISNLKTNFEGVETVEDLMRLVQASASSPDLQARLRDTLNMARDTDKWRKLTRMLAERVVWDDSTPRLFVVPTGSRPLGLLFRTNKGQADFENPTGLVYQPPLPTTGQLLAVRTSDRSLAGCGRHLESLKQLAASYWALPQHPGWALLPEPPKWEHANPALVLEVFAEVLGQGDPLAAAELHWANITATLAASGQTTGPSGSAGPSPLRSPTPLSSGNHAAAVAAVMAAADNNGLLAAGAAAGGGNGGFGGSGNHAGAAAAAAAGGSGMMAGGMGRAGSRAVVSPFEGPTAMTSAVLGAAAAGGSGAFSLAASGQLGSGQGVAGGMGSARPSGVLSNPNSAGMMMVPPGHHEASPFALPAGSMMVSARTTSEQTSDTGSHSIHNHQQQQQQPALQQQQMLPRGTRSLGPGLGQVVGQVPVPVPARTVSGPAFTAGPFSGIPGDPGAWGGPGGARQLSGPLLGGPGSVGPGQGAAAQAGAVDPLLLSSLGLASDGSELQGTPAAPAAAAVQLPQGPFASVQQPLVQQQQPLIQQQQQQQGGMGPQLSSKTLLLQQAIVEGWPAPQVKSLLDQMSDAELQQLVELHAASEAAAAAAAGGAAPGAAAAAAGAGAAARAAAAPAAAGGSAAVLTGFGSSVPIPSGNSGMGSGLMQGGGAAARGNQPLQQQQQQQMLSPPKQGGTAAAAAGAAPTGGAAAAALSALYADGVGAAGGSAGELRVLSDITLAGDQGQGPGGLLNLDSFTGDPAWGELFADLRNLGGSSSGQPPALGSSLTGNNSFTTDWIPELLATKATAAGGGNSNQQEAAAAAAAGGQQQEQQGVAAAAAVGAAAAAAAAGGDGGDGGVVEGGDGLSGRRGKRERSKTSQAPTAEQQQEWQAMFGVDDPAHPELRSLSKGQAHYDSFNRHFPMARLTSKTAEVQQGAQVSNPWAPGQRLSATGVAHPAAIQPLSPGSPNPFADQQLSGSPMATGSPLSRPPVTTQSPKVPERALLQQRSQRDGSTGLPSVAEGPAVMTAAGGGGVSGQRAATPPVVAPPAQTQEGAAAVENLMGLSSGASQLLDPLPEASLPSGGLREILGMMSSDAAAAAADGSGGGGAAGAGGSGLGMFLMTSQRTDSDAAAVAAAAAADNPFSLAAQLPMHPPAPQPREALVHRDSLGRTGWISSLFRRSSSWSSKSNSGAVGSGGSGSGPSGGSHTSKDPAGVMGLTHSGSVRGPAAAGAAAGAAPGNGV